MVEEQHLLGDFHFWAEMWLKVSIPRLKESSIVKYRNLLRSYIYPQISNLDISEIKYNDISEMCTLLLCKGGRNKQGLSPKTVSSVLSVTKSIIQYASRINDISLASLDCLYVKQPQKPMRILSQEEQNRLIEYLLSNINTINLGILLSVHTGIRIGDDDKIRLNQRKPSKYKGLRRFGPEKNLQRINKFMKERPIFYKNLIQMKENIRFYLRCFYCITKVMILQFNSENRTELARNG